MEGQMQPVTAGLNQDSSAGANNQHSQQQQNMQQKDENNPRFGYFLKSR